MSASNGEQQAGCCHRCTAPETSREGKGAGQAGCMAAPQVILDALTPLRVGAINMPATPERIGAIRGPVLTEAARPCGGS
jgi:hypothetical protein